MERIKGGVTAAKGFQAAAAAAHIKYADRTDMAMIYSEKPCKTAGTFTSNIVKAAPVTWDRAVVESGVKSQAVIVNSGIANACTGAEGGRICQETAGKAAEVLGIDEAGVLIGSTGVIGMQIPMERVKAGIEKLAADLGGDLEHGSRAAKAIMTTDTRSDRDRREDRDHRRHGKGVWHDPSQHVYHAGIYHDRRRDLQKGIEKSAEPGCGGHL